MRRSAESFPLSCLPVCLACVWGVVALAACSGGSTGISPDAGVGSQDAEVGAGELPGQPDAPSPPDEDVRPAPGAFVPFGEPPADGTPTIFLRSTAGNGPGMVRIEAVGRNLGKIAGVALYIEFDPAALTASMTETDLSMSDANPYFTIAKVEEIRPGVISFGAARFCKDKMPWGSVDQCGGREIVKDTVLMEAAFNLLSEAETALRMPQARIVIRRPDRSRVEAVPVGGMVQAGGAR